MSKMQKMEQTTGFLVLNSTASGSHKTLGFCGFKGNQEVGNPCLPNLWCGAWRRTTLSGNPIKKIKW